MRKRTRNLSSISLALAVLMASDAAMVIAGYLPGSGERGLAAQEASSRLDEEQMFLEARRAMNREQFDRASELFQAFDRSTMPGGSSPTRTTGRRLATIGPGICPKR